MPVVRFIKRFAAVPDTWEGWAVRVLTVAVILVFGAAMILLSQTASLREQVANGRSERTAYQEEQTVRVCQILRHLEVSSGELRDAKC